MRLFSFGKLFCDLSMLCPAVQAIVGQGGTKLKHQLPQYMGHPLIIGEHCRIQDVFRGNQISDFLTIGAASFGQIPYNAPHLPVWG